MATFDPSTAETEVASEEDQLGGDGQTEIDTVGLDDTSNKSPNNLSTKLLSNAASKKHKPSKSKLGDTHSSKIKSKSGDTKPSKSKSGDTHSSKSKSQPGDAKPNKVTKKKKLKPHKPEQTDKPRQPPSKPKRLQTTTTPVPHLPHHPQTSLMPPLANHSGYSILSSRRK